MSNVYIVKSGQLVDFSGWEWLNLRAFSDYDKAIEYKSYVESQIKPARLGEFEDVEIETLTLEA
jgi:hypothetical protein